MTEHIKVGGEGISALVDELARAHGEMGRTLEDLQTSLDQLSTQWSGAAQHAYARAQERWSVSMQHLHDELDRARHNTQLSNEAFADAARATQRLWSE
ncbi:WXG100 family type VII secretion target [Agromyces protaetiae]|uniref:ESAT-6-like protein n=1 Tax=Agromyces protaetiae TaxID=2509455 RepID=A0A4P6FA99_9MICO|nr:WXG100 family type VII secretion target [Agromyces protaetiae]QAY72882.1 WXG100 family type VII secretion target [Agromyces protaetiae]